MPFSVFCMSNGGHLWFCALLVFSSYPNELKSMNISLWASDSYGKYIPVYTMRSRQSRAHAHTGNDILDWIFIPDRHTGTQFSVLYIFLDAHQYETRSSHWKLLIHLRQMTRVSIWWNLGSHGWLMTWWQTVQSHWSRLSLMKTPKSSVRRVSKWDKNKETNHKIY